MIVVKVFFFFFFGLFVMFSFFFPASSRNLIYIPGNVGFENAGNSCYIGSILQCMIHAVPLVVYLLSNRYLKHIKYVRDTGGKVGVCFSCIQCYFFLE
jgi:ubiquitin C-terminal hydrolase